MKLNDIAIKLDDMAKRITGFPPDSMPYWVQDELAQLALQLGKSADAVRSEATKAEGFVKAVEGRHETNK